MDPTLAVVVVAGMTLCGPLLLSWLNGRQLHKAKLVDWARQDAVAEQAAEAARLLLAANERVAVTAAKANAKLDVIHGLVNSNMTAAMESEYDAVRRDLASMREVIELRRAAGQEPSAETQAEILAAETRVAELAAALDDRRRQQAVADAQA